MNLPDDLQARLHFLARVVARQCRHLQATDRRVFTEPFSVARAEELDGDIALAERVEAFARRFARLQDTLGRQAGARIVACPG